MAWKNIPDHARAALAHLAEKFAKQPAPGAAANVDWAHRIVAKYRQGEAVAPATLQIACEALSIPFPPKKENNHGNP